MKWVMIKVEIMKGLLTLGNICILLILLIGTGFTSAENNNNQPYNENNFIPFQYHADDRIDFSPDGKKFVYCTKDIKSDTDAIWVMNIENGNITIVYANNTIDKAFTPPKFSPDGEKILFVSRYRDNDIDLTITSIDILIKNGTEWNSNVTPRQLFMINSTNGYLQETVYNNDGSKIVYSIYGLMHKGAADFGEIFIMDSDGTNHKRLTNDKRTDKLPTFSPDGSKIAWIHREGEPLHSRIWIMNSDGSNKKCITPDFNYCNNPTFTPNGKILFECEKVSPHSNKVEDGNIWMIDADGSNPILIAPTKFGGSVHSTNPAISPDNTMIVFFHGLSAGTANLYYIKDPDGDGIWEDSDGDGVADVCDGAPNDPDEGYIKGNVSDGFIHDINIIYLMIMIASVAIFSKKKY